MADPRFHAKSGPFTLGELAALSGSTLGAGANPALSIADVSALADAGATDISFLDNPKYLPDFRTTGALACIVAPKHADKAPAGLHLLLNPAPYKAYALVAQKFYPLRPASRGVHPSAVVDATAELGEGVEVAAGAVIGPAVRLGAGTIVGPNAVIGENVVVGRDCRIGALVSISHTEIGSGVTLHPGVRIGQDGFGFAPDPAGHVKVPQLGRVTMNMIVVDVTDVKKIKVGDIATIIGSEKKQVVSAEDWGDWSGSFNYEITTRINPNLIRKLIS